MKPLSRSQMSSKYRKAKKGLSSSSSSSSSRRKGCKSNTDILCAWNTQRKTKKSLKSLSITGESLLPHYPLTSQNDVPCDNRGKVFAGPFLELWCPKLVKLLPNFHFEYLVEGRSSETDVLALFREKNTKAYLLVRLTDMNDSKVPSEQALAAQQAFESKLGKLIPRVHFAHILDDGQSRCRIFGMDPVQGTVNHLLEIPEKRRKISKIKLAQKVKELLKVLRDAKLEHGDLQFGNISYRLRPSGDIESIGLIDFEYSTPLHDRADDTEGILCDANSFGLLPFMEKVGIIIPEWMQEAIERGKDPREENPTYKGPFRSPYSALKLDVIDCRE